MKAIQVLLLLFVVSFLDGELINIADIMERRENTPSDDMQDMEEEDESQGTKMKEGDMKETRVQSFEAQGLIKVEEPLEDLTKWPSTTIPYVFAKGYTGQKRIKEAFLAYAKKSCIRFRPRRPTDKDYLYFYNGRGCWSFIGRIGGKQHVSLPYYCRKSLGTPVHEILHALGFYHEQSREDRDKYIHINWENIKQRAKQNFEEHEQQDHGYPYDYDSVMHYSDHSFSRNGAKTIKVLNGPHHIGQRTHMSKIDAQQLNAHYCGGSNGKLKGKRGLLKTSFESWNKRTSCNPEEGDVCDDTETCPELFKNGECYKCSVQKTCPTACKVEDKKCGKWEKEGFCLNKRYRKWMKINCGPSCKSECVDE